MRFLADEMLKKMCRWMRVLGFPTAYVEGMDDDEIMAKAKKSRAMLLTRDEELYRRCFKRSIPAFLVHDAEVEQQLASLIRAHSLKLPPFPSGTFCPRCGGKLMRVPKKGLKGKVYPRVLQIQKVFWRCRKCHHIYWMGTHYSRLQKGFEKIKRLASAKTRISPQ